MKIILCVFSLIELLRNGKWIDTLTRPLRLNEASYNSRDTIITRESNERNSLLITNWVNFRWLISFSTVSAAVWRRRSLLLVTKFLNLKVSWPSFFVFAANIWNSNLNENIIMCFLCRLFAAFWSSKNRRCSVMFSRLPIINKFHTKGLIY